MHVWISCRDQTKLNKDVDALLAVQGTEVDLSLSFNTNSLTNVSLGRMLPVAFNITYTSQTTSLLAGQRNASRARMFIQASPRMPRTELQNINRI